VFLKSFCISQGWQCLLLWWLSLLAVLIKMAKQKSHKKQWSSQKNNFIPSPFFTVVQHDSSDKEIIGFGFCHISNPVHCFWSFFWCRRALLATVHAFKQMDAGTQFYFSSLFVALMFYRLIVHALQSCHCSHHETFWRICLNHAPFAAKTSELNAHCRDVQTERNSLGQRGSIPPTRASCPCHYNHCWHTKTTW